MLGVSKNLATKHHEEAALCLGDKNMEQIQKLKLLN